MFCKKRIIINCTKTIEIFKKLEKGEKIKMRIQKIKDNYFEKLEMNKFDLLVTVINEIGNFPYIMSGIYLNNEKIRTDLGSLWND